MDAVNLFIFGAGYSASATVASLRAETDCAVAATTRDDQKREALQARNISAHIFDGTASGATLRADLRAATHLLISIAPGPESDPVLRQHRADILAAPNLRWIGYYSTIGVYGDAEGQWIDETAPPAPLSARNRYRVEAEEAWRALTEENDIPLAILRLAGIYGPGRSPFDKLRNGTARRINKPGQVFNRIHVDDIAAITARAALGGVAGTFNVSDDEPAPPQDVVAHAASLMGVAPPPELAFAEADLSPMARSFYSGNRRVSNAKIKAALGYELIYPTYRDGHAAIRRNERD